ncbi:hypothetical protein [Limibacillus sp. MBR-115]|jgi:hypothetical protein|uniref:hypothetical protein n=1 Tax=Limibacillus sp. MBR-115 TaxID=3156465 RepID=UPI003399E9A3
MGDKQVLGLPVQNIEKFAAAKGLVAARNALSEKLKEANLTADKRLALLRKLFQSAQDLGCSHTTVLIGRILLAAKRDEASIYRAIGIAHLKLGHNKRAVAALGAAYQHGRLPDVLVEFGAALKAIGGSSWPVEQIDNALGLKPGVWPRAMALPLTLTYLGRGQEAVDHVATATKAGCAWPQFDAAAAWVLAKHRLPKGVEHLEKLMDQHPLWPLKRTRPRMTQALVMANRPRQSVHVGKQYTIQQIFGGANFAALVPGRKLAINYGLIESLHDKPDLLRDRKIEVVLGNAMAEVDEDIARQAKELCDQVGIPLVNAPASVRNLRRDENYRRLKDRSDLLFPKTLRYNIADADLKALKTRILSDFAFPLLVRPTTSQYGGGMHLCEGHEALDQALATLAKRRISPEIFAIEFHDAQRNEKGHYKVYRCAWIDGELLPVNCFFNNHWNTHGENDQQRSSQLRASTLINDPAFHAEEAAFMADVRGYLGKANSDALMAACEGVGVDICGMDFGLTEDGRPLIFEINPNMLLWWYRVGFPHFWPAADRTIEAIEGLLLRRAARA